MESKKEYDLIVSLGGNCAAAHNLRLRGLRLFSYPFDWTYFEEDTAIYKIADGFENQFQNHLLKENLIELPVNPSHLDCIQYKDDCSKIVWANHFHNKITDKNEYQQVYEKIKKRFLRLIKHIEMSKKVLFLFSIPFEMELKPLEYLYSKLKDLYPSKQIEIIALSFSCRKEETLLKEGITLYQYKRKINEYDFRKTNYEWHFLDDFDLSFLFRPKANALMRFMIKNCPIKKLRKKLRKKYHVS